MAWEWAAPVASITVAFASGTVAISIALAGFRHTQKLAESRNEQDRKLTEERHEHDRKMAADARIAARLEATYSDLLELVYEIGRWSEQIRPMFDSDPPRVVPPPKLDNEMRTVARVNAFGSAEVRDLVDEWRAAVREIALADQKAAHAQERVNELYSREQAHQRMFSEEEWAKVPDPDKEVARIANELQPAEQRAREALTRQISRELGHSVSD